MIYLEKILWSYLLRNFDRGLGIRLLSLFVVPTNYLDGTFICTRHYISPKKVSLKKILKCKLINDISKNLEASCCCRLYQLLENNYSIILQKSLIYYRNDNLRYLNIEGANQSKRLFPKIIWLKSIPLKFIKNFWDPKFIQMLHF